MADNTPKNPKKLLKDILQNDAKRVDFDLDNWISDFENGFPRFQMTNPNLNSGYWGQSAEHRPRIKELNVEADAQAIEGYRLIEFFPDREIKEESYILMGTPVELMTQISFFMNLHRMLQTMDIGQFVGYPVDEYLRAKPRQDITAQIILTSYKTPPYYQYGDKWFTRRQVTIPMVDKRKITFKNLKDACGGDSGQNWGEWTARAYLSLEKDTAPIHQMVASGNTENAAIQNLEKFLQFTKCSVRRISTHKLDYSKGDLTLLSQQEKARLMNYDVYPAWVNILNTKLAKSNNTTSSEQKGKRVLGGKLLKKSKKLYLWTNKEPSWWNGEIREVLKDNFSSI